MSDPKHELIQQLKELMSAYEGMYSGVATVRPVSTTESGYDGVSDRYVDHHFEFDIRTNHLEDT